MNEIAAVEASSNVYLKTLKFQSLTGEIYWKTYISQSENSCKLAIFQWSTNVMAPLSTLKKYLNSPYLKTLKFSFLSRFISYFDKVEIATQLLGENSHYIVNGIKGLLSRPF